MIFTILPTIEQWGFSVGLLLAAAVVGIVVELVVVRQIRRLSKKTQWKGDDIVARSLRGLVMLLAVVLTLESSAAQLPLTEQWQSNVVLARNIGIIILAAWTIQRMIAGYFNIRLERNGSSIATSSIANTLISVGVWITAAAFILQTAQIEITPLLTAMGVGGIAIALGLQDTLSSIFSGISMIASRKIEIGNYIQIGTDQKGTVEDINWRYTILRDTGGKEIIVPNATLSKAVITNQLPHREDPLISIQYTVDQKTNLEAMEKAIINAANDYIATSDLASSDAQAYLRCSFTEQGGISCMLYIRSATISSQFKLKHELTKLIQSTLKKKRIRLHEPIVSSK